jgi:hypothetical protein
MAGNETDECGTEVAETDSAREKRKIEEEKVDKCKVK